MALQTLTMALCYRMCSFGRPTEVFCIASRADGGPSECNIRISFNERFLEFKWRFCASLGESLPGSLGRMVRVRSRSYCGTEEIPKEFLLQDPRIEVFF